MTLIVWQDREGWTAFNVWVSSLEDGANGYTGAMIRPHIDQATQEALDEAERREIDGEADDGSGFAFA